MKQAFDEFKENMKYVKELDTLFLHLRDTLHLPSDLSDLLRAEWVYSVSALDKLIHELIKLGMLEAFQGKRPKTKGFMNFSISLETHSSIVAASEISLPPSEYWFEQAIIQKHKALSFQHPDKIVEGLSLVWSEAHKWQYLANKMGEDEKKLIANLKTIIDRRNKIVHEADLSVLTGKRNSVEWEDVKVVIKLVENLSEEIYKAVKLS